MGNIVQKKKYPGITHFNLDSHFIYDLSNSKDFLRTTNDKNNMKLNANELNKLKDEISNISKLFDINKEKKAIDISLDDLYSINDYFYFDKEENSIVVWFKNCFNKIYIKENISLQKMANLYSTETGSKVGKTKMFYIFKNKMNLSFLKTSVKTSKIISPNSLSFFYKNNCKVY